MQVDFLVSADAAPPSALAERFEHARAAARRNPSPPRADRDRRLAALARLLRENMDVISAAIREDFGHRSPHETQLLEIFPSIEAIKHARRHLKAWMRPERRLVSLWFMPGGAKIVSQPLGVVGIIVPWNYPIYLAVGPLVAALAAGNRVLVKMSELTPITGALFGRLASRYFRPDEVAIIEGDADVAKAFAGLPFDHLLFTGSTQVGHSVMRAAAENLTPVTLELGGKSPAIVGKGYSLRRAAERIAIGKCMNAGQTCIAPDYALVPAGTEREFVAQLKAVVAKCYPDIRNSPDYTTIINDRHFARLTGYLADARDKGAEIVPLAVSDTEPDATVRRFPPVALLGVTDDMRVMQDEIFGPLLPVVPYHGVDGAIKYVNARPRPLALYYFDDNGRNIGRVLAETVSGGVTLNDTILHIAQDGLPFGGVGASGMGHYHGREGFDTFSKKKGVFLQSRVNTIGLFKPPYGKLFERLVRILLR